MPSRREFFRNAALLTGATFASGVLPPAIARAMAIDPPPDTTFRDAEHVVILMQENRSFDHAYGSLQGVRGFRDPRAHRLPNGNPVWFQTDAAGATYAPFRLDMTRSNATWIGGLPHSWPDQVDARAGGRYDQWLIAKPKRDLPFTLGFYGREDIPFYYALADAFTLCDQAFCSSLTGTTPNRLFLWTGTIRRDAADRARVMNSDTDYDKEANWYTFPERLEDAGVSWRIYQNEISLDTGFDGEHDSWLGNFTDNPIEWFTQYRVRFSAARRAYLPRLIAEAPSRIAAKERELAAGGGLAPDAKKKLARELEQLRKILAAALIEREEYTNAAWDALAARPRSLHERAFATNTGDPRHRTLSELTYQDGGTARTTPVPSGDVLHQFRKDVAAGTLPAVSWLVAPENFSDHPGAPWYGAWYVSETLDILTKNPEVWKKTIFILCYDENDGYFDHVPPFVPPHPDRPATGKVSAGIHTGVEWANAHGRDSAVGLGFRVPLVVASPWSRGGWVNSQVADHTSVLRFLETWLTAKGRNVKETNISDWRRTVCGDLTSAFRPYDGGPVALPTPIRRDATVERIHAARFREQPRGGAALSPAAISQTDVGALQEPGTRPSCALPYELIVNAQRADDGLRLVLEARDRVFGAAAAGAPFNVYSYDAEFAARAYAVRAGDAVTDTIPVGVAYRVRVDGPNGFMREFSRAAASAGAGAADAGAEALLIAADHASGTPAGGALALSIKNRGAAAADVTVRDESYGSPARVVRVGAGEEKTMSVTTESSGGWYDVTVSAGTLAYRYAGRVETGRASITDPAMGGVRHEKKKA